MSIMQRALKMDSLIASHSAVTDKYDPEKRVALCVDEWSNWYDVEPGTNPGFLHQQNTLRDAVTAAGNLDIFQAHADRVRLANITQMANVLQAMILTGATLQGGALGMDLPAKSVVASRCDRPRS
jgi:alpha-N-arabinofuranosidase